MNPDFLDLLRALLAADARFMIVGAYAVGLVPPRTSTCGSKLPRPMLRRSWLHFKHSAHHMGLTEVDLQQPGIGLQIGVAPGRVDVLTNITGVRFEDAWPGAVRADFGEEVRCPVIGLSALLANKRASARPQDLADVAALERLQRARRG